MIPRSALILAALSILPFLWGGLTTLWPDLAVWSVRHVGGRFTGPYLQLAWGQIVLVFHAGALWGYSLSRASLRHTGLAAFPAIWAFLMVGGGPVSATINLIIGFVALLAIDTIFERDQLTPDWWMRMRVPTSIVIILCLGAEAVQ